MSRPNLLHCTIALAGLVVAAGASAAEPTPTPAKATAATTEDLICRDRLRPGSHIAMRTCLTRAQWAVARAQGSLRAPLGLSTHAGVQDGAGPWGAVSTVGASVGMSAFTQR